MRAKKIWPILLSLLLLISSLQCAAVTRLFSPGEQPENRDQGQPQPIPNNEGQANPQPQPFDEGEIGGDQPDYKLEGIWVSDTDTGYGTTMHTELVLEYTGTFSQQVTAGSLMTLDTGTYDVGDGWIRFTVTHHEPTEYKGKELNWMTGWTYYYTFIDENTVEFEDRLLGASWYAYRQ